MRSSKQSYNQNIKTHLMKHLKRENLRKVKVIMTVAGVKNERSGYFHRWANFKEFGERGSEKWVSALIEFEDGRVQAIAPDELQFIETT